MPVSARSRGGASLGIIGYGAVGRTVVSSILDGKVSGMNLGGGILDRRRMAPASMQTVDLGDLIDRSDVIVEAAGPEALKVSVRRILEAGKTLVALSIGAFLSEEIKGVLDEDHAGKLVLSTGALGGLDFIRALATAGTGIRIELSSRKQPTSLIQPWMSETQRRHLSNMTATVVPEVIFSGNAIEASRLFPANLNVAAALAIAGGDTATLSIELVADPTLERTIHCVRVQSDLGDCEFVVRNRALSDNPATSAVTPWAVLRCLNDLSSPAKNCFC